MTRRPTQQLLPFGDPPETPRPDVVPHRQGREAQAAFRLLEAWLAAPPGGRMTDLAEVALFSARKVLIEGKSGYHHQAEDCLEALKVLNGPTAGPDIAPGPHAPGDGDFHGAVEAALDALHGQFLARLGGGRTGP